MSSSNLRRTLLVTFAVLTIIFGSLSFSEFYQIQQLKSQSAPTSTVTVTLTPSTVLNVSSLISSNEALKAVMNFKGWNATQMASYAVYTELDFLNVSGGWLNTYTVDPSTGRILNLESSESLKIPDPTVKLRGYYWHVDINADVKTVAPGKFPEAGINYDFWVNAVNATIAYSEGPYG